MFNIVLFGPPGAGKGTQSDKLIQKYKLVHISTGDLFRKHLRNKTELGLLADQYMNEGKLVPDRVVLGMVKDKIDQHLNASGFIFDGFPRTVHQAEELDKVLKTLKIRIDVMIELEVEELELKKRLKKRAKIEGRLDDQDENKINNRIQVYKTETLPVATFYQNQQKYHKVSGIGEIDVIFKQICDIISQVHPS